MKKFLYNLLTDIRDSRLCPYWLTEKIDDLRYAEFFYDFWRY